MPGTRLLALVSRWFEPAIVAGVFEPLVADWQREWQAAPRAARVMVRARGTIAFILTALRLAPHLALAPLPAPLPGLLMVSVLAVCAAGPVVELAGVALGAELIAVIEFDGIATEGVESVGACVGLMAGVARQDGGWSVFEGDLPVGCLLAGSGGGLADLGERAVVTAGAREAFDVSGAGCDVEFGGAGDWNTGEANKVRFRREARVGIGAGGMAGEIEDRTALGFWPVRAGTAGSEEKQDGDEYSRHRDLDHGRTKTCWVSRETWHWRQFWRSG